MSGIHRTLGRIGRVLRCLRRDRSGVAFVELALVAPTLVLLYCGAYVVSDLVTCGRKVSLTAKTVTDLTTRYATVSSTDLTSIMSNSKLVLAPYSTSNATMRVSELQITDASHASVVWSQAQNATALTTGTIVTLPTNFAPTEMQPNPTTSTVGAYIVMGEVGYTYTPLFGGTILPSPTLYNRYFMLPRLTTQVALQ